jgi:oligopeptidase A
MNIVNTTNNPLLQESGFPDFKALSLTENLSKWIEELINTTEKAFIVVEKNLGPTWSSSIEKFSTVSDILSRGWGLVGHLTSVKNSIELREIYAKYQPKIIELSQRMAQCKSLYENVVKLKNGVEWENLNSLQKRVIDKLITELELQGIALKESDKQRFLDISIELANLSTNFSNNILDEFQQKGILLENISDINGIPASILERASAEAIKKGYNNSTLESGPWFILAEPSMSRPFLKFCQNQFLRKQLYLIIITIASSDKLNNLPIIDRILKLSFEKSSILGYNNPADVSLVTKMAGSVLNVRNLLTKLTEIAKNKAKLELIELTKLAHSELSHWDIPFWSEKLKNKILGFDSETLRPYFQFEYVINGLFKLSEDLFSVRIIPSEQSVSTWHPDVKLYDVVDINSNKTIAYFYLDPFVRPSEKRSGAWMGYFQSHALTIEGIKKLPIVQLICNQAPPLTDTPSLMTFEDVMTLFHEFGHGIQHMLTTVECEYASGLNNVEWDAIEIVSQFMENWCYQPQVLRSLTKHYQTNECLPESIIEKITDSRKFLAGLNLVRQLHFSILDIDIYENQNYDPNSRYHELGKEILPLLPLEEDRFICAFSHIFAGGYKAGYYSYKWSEILSADIFEAFVEVADYTDVKKRFRDTFLALGGGTHPMEVFKLFRGREPSLEPLLRHQGLN